MVLNYAIFDYQIVVGTLDVTRAITGFGVAHNQAEPGEPLIWSGTLSLTNPLPPYQLLESLDNLVNPGRWAKGAYPIKIYFWGKLFLTLRILDYNYDPDTQTAEATLTDKLGLIKQSGEGKDKPLKGFAPSASINLQGQPTISRQPWAPIARAIATQGSTIRNTTLIPETDIILPDNPGRATYSNPPSLRGDAVAQLANVASASANLWVWCDKNENIRFCSYPRLGSSPIYRLSREQVEDFKRLPPDPADEVTTVEVEGQGTGIKEIKEKEIKPEDLAKPINDNFQDDPNEEPTTEPLDSEFRLLVTEVKYPIIIESPKEGDLLKRQTIFQPLIGSSTVVRREETLGRIDTVIPDSKNTNFITSEEINTQEYYSSFEGKLLSKRVIKVEPLGKIASDIFPGETARITSEDLTEDWEYNLDGPPIRRVVTIRRPVCIVFKDKKSGTGRIPAEKTIEEWIKLSGDITGAKYQHQTLNYKTKGELYPDKYPKDATLTLSPDQPEPEIVDFVPQPIYKETRTPLTINSPIKEKEFDNAGDTPGSETEDTVTLTDAPDEGDALDEVAETAGTIRRQRIGARDISHPLRREDLSNFRPFQVVDIHNGRFVRDEFKIALGDDKELSCLYVGNLMGVIVEPVADPPTHILLLDSAITNIPITEGASITPIKLQSGQGVGPFTYSVEDLPDGLTLTGSEVVGTPTTTGTTATTITVTDSLGNTYTQVLNFNSSSVPPAIAHYRQINRFKYQTQHQGNWRIVATPRTNEISPISSIRKHQGSWQLTPLKFPLERQVQGRWGLVTPSAAPTLAYRENQGHWTINPLYFKKYRQHQGEWVVEDIAQFLYRRAGFWKVDPLYFRSRRKHQGNWTIQIVGPPPAAEHPYTATSVGVWSSDPSLTISYTKLTDFDLTTGCATASDADPILIDFGEAVVVSAVQVGAGTVEGETGTYNLRGFLNQCQLYWSVDNTTWTNTDISINLAEDDSTVTYPISPSITARFWKLDSYSEFLGAGTCQLIFF